MRIATNRSGKRSTPTKTIKERVARVGPRRHIVIPRDILDRLQLQPGDFVVFATHKNGVLMKPKNKIDPDDTLTPEEAKTVRRGEAQLKRGDSKPWREVKRALSL
jgi:bifunctional DNA-binding transcriptional regulator/antitoxin component of YhaV-PrlF toxin-antitoxin module